MGVLMLETRRG